MPGPKPDGENSTEWFVVAEHIHDRGLAARACQAVLDLMKSNAARAAVDAYTDYRKAMPPDAVSAEEAPHARGKQQHRREIQGSASSLIHRGLTTGTSSLDTRHGRSTSTSTAPPTISSRTSTTAATM
jgi:hypothetical protein